MKGSQFIWILNGLSFMLISGALADGVLLQNVALNQAAVQSTSTPSGAANKAVDGNREDSCSSTESEPDPWWRVDLQQVYKVAAVRVTSSLQHKHRLNGAEIWIGEEIQRDTHFRCGVITRFPKGDSVYVPCSSSEGRYVTVLLHGSQRTLTLCEVEVFPLDDGNNLPNLALGGKAIQSSTYFSAPASKAIDGRKNSNFDDGFCSSTVSSEAPWWRLDLQKEFAVTAVKVTNRADCCPERLDGAEIRIGNSLENNGNNNPWCASISHIGAGETITFYCSGGSIKGRFVNLLHAGQGNRFITLCEVEVYAAPEVEPVGNVALTGNTEQSTTSPDSWISSNAINGGRSGFSHIGGCSHTANQTSPWWMVDLLAKHRIRAVSVYNRKDCCSSRLQGAEIWIGNSLNRNNSTENSRCSKIPAGLSFTFHCGEMEGRYVFVTNPGGQKILTLCEVEVYASVAEVTTPPPPTESLLLGDMNVTLVGKKLCWSDALLYCRRHYWDLLSLGSQQEQSQVEQLLTHSSFTITEAVWIGLRRDLIGYEWFWMTGEAIDFSSWFEETDFTQLEQPCGGIVKGGPFKWRNLNCGEHLNFVCQTGGGGTAQRVYFYSSRQDTSP